MLSYTISEIDPLGPFGQKQNVVAKLDKNQNDSVDGEEARGLLSVDADIRLLVQYVRCIRSLYFQTFDIHKH